MNYEAIKAERLLADLRPHPAFYRKYRDHFDGFLGVFARPLAAGRSSGRGILAAKKREFLLFGLEYLVGQAESTWFRSEILIVDNREVGATIFDQVDAAMAYFRECLQTRFEFYGVPVRDVIWEGQEGGSTGPGHITWDLP